MEHPRVNLQAINGVSTDQVNLSKMIESFEKPFDERAAQQSLCGSIAYKFFANYKDNELRLAHDSKRHILTLTPKDFDATGVFTASYLEFYFV